MSEAASNSFQAIQTYIDGKMRRYNLLFTVNGAAFAIVTFASEAVSEEQGGGTRWIANLPGDLELPQVAMGAILFTILMFLDIWAWGWQMRRDFLPNSFTLLGRAILAGIATLIICGWALGAGWMQSPVSFGSVTLAALLIAGLVTGNVLDYFHLRRQQLSETALRKPS